MKGGGDEKAHCVCMDRCCAVAIAGESPVAQRNDGPAPPTSQTSVMWFCLDMSVSRWPSAQGWSHLPGLFPTTLCFLRLPLSTLLAYCRDLRIALGLMAWHRGSGMNPKQDTSACWSQVTMTAAHNCIGCIVDNPEGCSSHRLQCEPCCLGLGGTQPAQPITAAYLGPHKHWGWMGGGEQSWLNSA